MSDSKIIVTRPRDAVRGGAAAQSVQNDLKKVGIKDVELFYDKELRMWAICQVHRPSGVLLTLREEHAEIRPEIMWWCKTNDGQYRDPSLQDVQDVIVTVQRAHVAWEKGGDWLADKFDEQDKKRDEAHRQKLKDKVHEIAPAMKKAIKEGKF